MRFVRRILFLFSQGRQQANLTEELEFHRSMLEQQARHAGEPASQAAMSARRAMGNSTLMLEESRAVWIGPLCESIWRDLVMAVRGVRARPGFSLVVVLVLASAIGLNTSLFTVFNAAALRPWPAKDPQRMVRIFRFIKNPPQGLDRYRGLSPVEFAYLSAHSRTMAGMFLDRGEGGLHLDDIKVHAEYVTGGFFQVLQVGMAKGRGFLSTDDRADSPEPVAVISYPFWQSHYAGDPNVVSRKVLLEGVSFTIIGITPQAFTGVTIDATDLWIPMSSMALLHPGDAWVNEFLHGHKSCCADLGGRLAPGVTRDQARAELSVFAAELARQSNEPSDGVVLSGTAFLQSPGHKTREIYAVFSLMFAGLVLVLLMACANAGNLLLARASARRKEIAIRLSLGAGRSRIVRQLLAESLVLSCISGGLGVLLAAVLPGPLFHQAVDDATFAFRVDLGVLGYTLALAMLSSIAFGLAPALHATRAGLSEALQGRPAGLSPSFGLRNFLLAVQVAVSVILLMSAGLLIRGIQHVRSQDPGFAVNGNTAVSFDFPTVAGNAARSSAFFRSLQEELSSQPAAQPFGLADSAPLASSRRYASMRLPQETKDQARLVLTNDITPGYFNVLKIPIVEGRALASSDSGRGTVLVNQALAARFFAGESAIGKTIVTTGPFTIVGVVRNAHTWGLDDIDNLIYTPASYTEPLVLLLPQTPAAAAAVETIAHRLDPRVKLHFTPLSANLDNWLSGSRAAALIAGMVGLLALALATIGVSGVFAYAVQQRTQEIGIRMALGAQAGHVTALVLGSAGRSLIAGLAVGLCGAIAASRVIQQYLYGLGPFDAITYTGVFVTLAAAGLAATYLPARRAIRLDPARALRC